jgi:hypothetical protein
MKTAFLSLCAAAALLTLAASPSIVRAGEYMTPADSGPKVNGTIYPVGAKKAAIRVDQYAKRHQNTKGDQDKDATSAFFHWSVDPFRIGGE